MAFKRTLIVDFSLANPLYAGATVTVYGVTGGAKDTSNLLTLYQDPTGSETFVNPQTLDSEGKWQNPVYVIEECILQITDLRIGDHDTGIIRPDIDDNDLLVAEYAATQVSGLAALAEGAARAARDSAAEAATSAASIDTEQVALVAQSFG